ncbi:hypothetical protein J2S66_000268 [Saccharothrix longispora]|uniref:FAD-binding domain-containing protein n=1 Tax=Saccharothrix longispora TaxID=33920 RepID=A0ABU1PPS7_9PSEU|nr:hypothetical protein [Saccharothrix longispora]
MPAGDAAHIHPPAGAVGVDVALADSVDLGWKPAATVLGRAPEGLLDSYHRERHEVGARVPRTSRAQALLGRRSPESDPVRDLFRELRELPEVGAHLAESVIGVSTRYDPGLPGAHPWLVRPDGHTAWVSATTDPQPVDTPRPRLIHLVRRPGRRSPALSRTGAGPRRRMRSAPTGKTMRAVGVRGLRPPVAVREEAMW